MSNTQRLTDGYQRETHGGQREENWREEGVKSHMPTCVIEAAFLIIAAVRVLTSQMCYILPRVQRCSRTVTAMQITIVWSGTHFSAPEQNQTHSKAKSALRSSSYLCYCQTDLNSVSNWAQTDQDPKICDQSIRRYKRATTREKKSTPLSVLSHKRATFEQL